MTDSHDLLLIWDQVLTNLLDSSENPHSVTPSLSPQQRAWLKQVQPLEITNGFALLAVPNPFAKDNIDRTLQNPIANALSDLLSEPITIAVKVVENDAPAHDVNDSHSVLRQAQNPDPTTGPWPRPPVVSSDRILPEDLPPYDPEHTAKPVVRASFPTENATSPSMGINADAPVEGAPLNTTVTQMFPRSEQSSASSEQAATTATSTPAASTAENATATAASANTNSGATPSASTAAGASQNQAHPVAPPTLNPRYTFENYVIGSSNRFATAAAWAVSESPASAYNPLFIWGGSGLGKTHLLHAIGHYTHTLYPNYNVRYVNTEEFTNDFINSLRDDRKEKFKKRYRQADLLLVDDIQFLEGREGIQEEFFYTFEALHNSNKQIVITSDRPPKLLSTLEDRLRTRFEWGLITDIQAPDLETRTAILSKKAQVENLKVPDDVLELIATSIDRNIRELEGALIRVTAFSSLNKQELTTELAQIVLRDLVPEDNRVDVSAATIMMVVAEYYKTSVDELCGPSKMRPLTTARQIAMYLCRELTEMSLPKIGATFGGRDHTTVMYAERKISKQIKDDRNLFTQVQELTSEVKKRACDDVPPSQR